MKKYEIYDHDEKFLDLLISLAEKWFVVMGPLVMSATFCGLALFFDFLTLTEPFNYTAKCSVFLRKKGVKW